MDTPKYSPIPPPEHHQQPPPQQPFENYVVLPSYYSPDHSRRCHVSLQTLLLLGVLLSLSLYVLWPSDPDLQIVRLRLKHVRVHMKPHISVDMSVATMVRVTNRDPFSVDFDALHVAIWYKGEELGHVTSGEGRVRAWGSSYVNIVAEFNGVEIHNWVYLLEDLVKGTVPFDTVSTINGRLGLHFVNIPVKAKISCEINVNVKKQTITHQSCYPEDGSTKEYNVQQRMVYEHTPSNNTSGYREVYQTRPYTNNVVPSPHVKLNNMNGTDQIVKRAMKRL